MKSIFATVTVLSAFFIGAQGLDLELRKVTCDESLPAYINSDDVSWECSGGGTQCTMGDTAIISGGSEFHYFLASDDFALRILLFRESTH
jgi:hypothetical protein